MSKSKKAIVTGVTGQDGAYLCNNLINKGYEVVGTYRRTSSTNFWRLEFLELLENDKLSLICHDLTDLGSNISLINSFKPNEIYNLAAQSFVGVSFEQPMTTAQITGLGALNILEAIRLSQVDVKFYQASTSEMFGRVQDMPQTEKTDFYPRSPYGVSKLFAHWSTVNYRESYDMFASSGILFNHESPLRGKEFVTRKISSNVAKISTGSPSVLKLGNIDAKRDWGYAGDYVEGMWRMLQADTPEDYVLATNRTVTVREFVKLSFESAGIEIEFSGEGIDEIAVEKKSGRKVMQIDKNFYRPAEVDILCGSSEKAFKKLGWSATTRLEDLVEKMVSADIDRLKAVK